MPWTPVYRGERDHRRGRGDFCMRGISVIVARYLRALRPSAACVAA
jgi:hypothetical protein